MFGFVLVFLSGTDFLRSDVSPEPVTPPVQDDPLVVVGTLLSNQPLYEVPAPGLPEDCFATRYRLVVEASVGDRPRIGAILDVRWPGCKLADGRITRTNSIYPSLPSPGERVLVALATSSRGALVPWPNWIFRDDPSGLALGEGGRKLVRLGSELHGWRPARPSASYVVHEAAPLSLDEAAAFLRTGSTVDVGGPPQH